MQMVKEWGIRWETRNQTAYPATFVVDQNGRIAWKKVSSTSAGRSTVEEILRELRKL
jgi:alkyl hydroperoxide reductase subunit AhpC